MGGETEKAAGLVKREAIELSHRLGEGTPQEVDRFLESTSPRQVIDLLEDAIDAGADREILVALLDAGRRPSFLRRIHGTPEADAWLKGVLRAIDAADLHVGDFLQLRARQGPALPLFRVQSGSIVQDFTRSEVASRVGAVAAGFHALLRSALGRVPVAIYSQNRIESILVDLACLSSGIVNVPIPADATPEHVQYILTQTGISILVVSDLRRLEGILMSGSLPVTVRSVVLIDPPEPGTESRAAAKGCLTLAQVEADGRTRGAVEVRGPKARELATLMFTSGTTGKPKGIRFSQRNILYKRFCRAVAIPEIGEQDVFLCYLPLFHTFGRWLEMTGCLFWGSCYVQMANPSAEAMLDAMRRWRPSVFISIPKRWIQLREKILQAAGAADGGSEDVDPAGLHDAIASVTGGRLRWGLSAAGHLDSDVFVFFQRHGIELLSGFGMTEATGGITMTPPHHYKRGTVGVPLPGIEARRGDDGELLARGPYMMLGYDDPDEPPRDYEKEWFGTGDLVEQDRDGYFTIVDRKKDIYKNVKGQTIAPAKIENMFTEFDEIKRVFLVGDGKEYNTLMIYPNYDAAGGKLARMTPEDLRDYMSSFVVSVNRFLSAYERIVDFELLPRFFSEEKGELTPKGSFVRRVVERNFRDLIDSLYARSYVVLPVGGIEVRIPTWLLREKGLTADALVSDPGGIRLQRTGERLAVMRVVGAQGRFRIGTYTYAIETPDRGSPATIDLDPILRVARYWVGNVELAHFAGEDLIRRPRRVAEPVGRISVEGWQRPILLLDRARERFASAIEQDERGPAGVHDAAALLLCSKDEEARRALGVLERFLADPATEEFALAQQILPLLRTHGDAVVRGRALVLSMNREVDARAGEILRRGLASDPDVLTEEVGGAILDTEMPPEAIHSLLDLTRDIDIGSDPWAYAAGRRRVASLLRFCVDLANRSPRWYSQAREVLVRRHLTEGDAELASIAAEERRRLDVAFRTWIASGNTPPVDPQSGEPMDWERVAGFDEKIPEEDRRRILLALRETTLLRESVFLIEEGVLVSGNDLLPGGIWVSDSGKIGGHRSARIALRTRAGGRAEFGIKLPTEVAPETAQEEVDWLIRLGAAERGRKIVAEFGGYWPEQRIWTEEYVQDEPVLATVRRMSASREPDSVDRLRALWPHLAWSALTAFIELWQRTGRKFVPARPDPASVAVAPHDYQEGSRLLSISPQRPFRGIAWMLRDLHEGFVGRIESEFPSLAGGAPEKIAIHAVVEALGEEAAIPLLWRALVEIRELLRDGDDPIWVRWQNELAAVVDEIEKDGYAPRRLVMAARRYRTWNRLNPEASLQARARTLQDLYDTYGLDAMEQSHPETRIRFFRMTVFAQTSGPLASELEAFVRAHRDAPLVLDALLRRMTILHRTVSLTPEESYFLARMSYSHLRPAQRVHLELLEEGGETLAELVEEIRDRDGEPLSIRAAASPKEVMRLHRLFGMSGLDVVFRPEHRFLVVIDEDETAVGGLFYRPTGRGSVHMEKVVIASRHRGKGVGEALMESFLQRMRDAGMSSVTTGFFRPHYFYRFGFRLEKGFAGLVRNIGGGGGEPMESEPEEESRSPGA
jgi:long-subunit acyl-CoA synthetase (AMP-forming)/predicted GNAT family acetyltransferase